MTTPGPDAAAYHEFRVTGEHSGQRLDKALAGLTEAAGLALSRSRLAQLVGAGAVTVDGRPADTPSRKVREGEHLGLTLPPPVAAEPEPEAIALEIVHEDADLIVVNKPAGMVVHPAPGAETGTLVNALLAHCGHDLPGIGGERRPGIIHRIDKDTSGLIVAAKSEAAMAGLAARFAAHDIQRRYQALAWGAPDRADPRLAGIAGVSFTEAGEICVRTQIARHPHDRKRMAVTTSGGRAAVTYLAIRERFGPAEKPFASLLDCRLETGRTHQIRVHAVHIGHPLIGDPTYGRARALPRTLEAALAADLTGFPRQALHAAELGFRHPVTGEDLHFSAKLPPDLHGLLTGLRRNPPVLR